MVIGKKIRNHTQFEKLVSPFRFYVKLKQFIFSHDDGHGHGHSHGGHGHSHSNSDSQIMKGVFLHILADTLAVYSNGHFK